MATAQQELDPADVGNIHALLDEKTNIVISDNIRLRCGHKGYITPLVAVRWRQVRKGPKPRKGVRRWIGVLIVECNRCLATWAWSAA